MTPEDSAWMASDSAMLVAQAIELARQCLAEDPFREVPTIQSEVILIVARAPDEIDEKRARIASFQSRALPAYAVAGEALRVAQKLAGTLA